MRDMSKIRTNHKTYKNYYTALDVMEMLECGNSSAYNLIATLNQELHDQGKIVFPGRVHKEYFHARTDIDVPAEKREVS